MKTAVLGVLALVLALTAIGCGRQTHERVQRDIARVAEELAEVLESDMPEEQKLERVRVLAERLETLSDQARELGPPPETERLRVDRTRPREHEAAKKLQAAAELLAEHQ